jgi:hypothetical protein
MIRLKPEEHEMSFDDKFAAAFGSGLADIKFCIRKTDKLSVDQLKEDALKFREAIEDKRVSPVSGVD